LHHHSDKMRTSRTSTSDTTPLKGSTSSSAEPNSAKSIQENDRFSRTGIICAALAFAVGSGNIWLLPAAIAEGGATFLMQFTICYIFAAIPLYYVEVALGQFTSASPWYIYQMLSSAMSGIPAAIAFNVVVRCIALSVWISVFLSMSFISLEGAWGELRYAKCWDDDCYDHRLAQNCTFAAPNNADCKQFLSAMSSTRADFKKATPVIHFSQKFLQEDESKIIFRENYTPDPMLMGSLVLTWILAILAASAGTRVIAKLSCAVIAIAVLCCVMLIVLAFTTGDIFFSLRHFYEPHPKSLYRVDKWVAAAGQALITLNVSTGGVIRIASARGFHHSLAIDVIFIAVTTIVVNAITLISMIALMEKYAADLYPFEPPDKRFHFALVHNYMSMMLVVETISGVSGGWAMAGFYFLQLAIVPFQVLVIYLWVLTSMLHEKYASSFRQRLHNARAVLLLIAMIILSVITSFFFILPGGFMHVLLLAKVCKDATFILGLLQLITVAYIYGFRRFSVNIRTMVGRSIMDFLWGFSWIATSPFIHVACFIGLFTAKIHYTGYTWRVIFSVMTFIWVPLNFLFKDYERKRIREPIQVMFRPQKDWGPAHTANREEARRMERAMRVL
uniref:Amino Acid-Polyamine-Organocation (APC) Family n=1 Tax=Haemonchus contortus TaxID=6289 RepID=A0A7I5EAQ1_HAECO